MLRPKSFHSIITLCEAGRLKEVVQLLLNTQNSPLLGLDPSIFSSVVQLCTDRNATKEGRFVHDRLRSIGYQSDLCLDNKLLIFYGKVGDVGNAREVFDGMCRRTVVSWSAMISVYTQNGLPDEALKVFVLMRRFGIFPNQFTFGSVLRACTGMLCLRSGNQVHGCAYKSGFMNNPFVQAAVVDLHGKCGSVEDARFIFETMVVRDLVSWNSMIGVYAVQGPRYESFRLFRNMLRKSVSFDHFTLSSLLKACGKVKDSETLSQIHTLIIKVAFTKDNIINGSLVDAYAKCRSMRTAKLLYESMQSKDLVSFTALITGYSQEKSCSVDVLELFHEINWVDFKLDNVMICSIIGLCASIAHVCLGRQLHAYSVKSQPNSDVAMSNALLDMYSKTGEIEDARHVFDEMKLKNVISWTSMINGYGKHGCSEDAFMLFHNMENEGVVPNDVTFLSLLSACSHTGLIDEGRNFLDIMVSKYGISPRVEHYSCLVDLLARGGKLEEAYDFLCNLDIKLNSSLWGALLGGCKLHSNTFLGKVAAYYLFDADTKSAVNYIVLANIYATSGLWNDAWKIRKTMEEKCTKKDAGWSSLQIFERKFFLLESS